MATDKTHMNTIRKNLLRNKKLVEHSCELQNRRQQMQSLIWRPLA